MSEGCAFLRHALVRRERVIICTANATEFQNALEYVDLLRAAIGKARHASSNEISRFDGVPCFNDF